MNEYHLYLEKLNGNDRIVLVHGEFDVLHPGHIRLLKFAKECGDVLIVGVNDHKDYKGEHRLSAKHRLEVVQSIDCVDHAFINQESILENIRQIKPWAVVKGHEFADANNIELEALNAYGGKLIFGSGELLSTKSSLFSSVDQKYSHFDFSELPQYAQRHAFDLDSVNQLLDKCQQINVVVIGEVIVDEYVNGTAVGMSQEDPTIVMTPTESKKYLGGAAITASHIKALGANNVEFISVVGEDDVADFIKTKCDEYQVNATLFRDYSRPSPLKTRYRVGNKTLLRVNQLRQHKISADIQDSILKKLTKIISKADLFVFSDFNYGMLPQALVDKICILCDTHKVSMVADSQSSSQLGDISRFHNMLLVTPTEREVRLALNNYDDGLVILADKLHRKSRAANIAITLGEEGVFIHKPFTEKLSWENDQLPALNTNALDPAGGGDCFLAAASLMLVAGAEPWVAFYVASVASACQVGRIGNRPLAQQKLIEVLSLTFRESV
ncbi:PfkB family carbohydrate kinase [Thalassotalea marina]|uniref:Bifunctional protein HldE n=1 Tax=Thalassotalea marina TaxID=1673741 RepID=A0A919EHW3_9GAMM|nr:PfkB family carbohydrate kinase [Thalassotalea marina]GHF80535.1 bifunctional protein HldE [Thalassotalea marina]